MVCKMKVLFLVLLFFVFESKCKINVTKVYEFAKATWNCDGHDPPRLKCEKRVKDGSPQYPYSCASWVAHCLVAGGWLEKKNMSRHGSMAQYASVEIKGHNYCLNIVSTHLGSCPQHGCLMEALLSQGWVKTSYVRKGTACAVKGSEDWGHAILGVGHGRYAAHNMAHWDKDVSVYHLDLCLDPPEDEVVY